MLAGRRRSWTWLAWIAALSVACAGAPAQPARLGLRLAPATLGVSLSLQQHLTVERQGRIDDLDAALEVDTDRLNLVGLAFGQRLFTLSYDGQTLQSWRHPLVPDQLRGEDVLEDLQLTLWPIEVIAGALPSDWNIDENGRKRILRLRGEPVMIIEYSAEPRWRGKIELVNLRYQYRLAIESVSTLP